MATLDKYYDGTSTTLTGGAETTGLPGVVVYQNRVDISKLDGTRQITTSDNVPLFTIPAGSRVLCSCISTVTASDSGTTGTLQIGTAGAPTGIQSGFNPDTDTVIIGTTAVSYVAAAPIQLSVATATVVNGVFDIAVTVAVML